MPVRVVGVTPVGATTPLPGAVSIPVELVPFQPWPPTPVYDDLVIVVAREMVEVRVM